MSVFLAQDVAAASVGGGEGFPSHREGQRPQRLQEAAQDQDQRSGALHQVRYQQIGFVTTVNGDGVFMQRSSAFLDGIIVVVRFS